jgi:hypothetical protein
MNRRVIRPHSLPEHFGEETHNMSLPGIDPDYLGVQPAAYHCTDCLYQLSWLLSVIPRIMIYIITSCKLHVIVDSKDPPKALCNCFVYQMFEFVNVHVYFCHRHTSGFPPGVVHKTL